MQGRIGGGLKEFILGGLGLQSPPPLMSEIKNILVVF